jgi:hypothetical protein
MGGDAEIEEHGVDGPEGLLGDRRLELLERPLQQRHAISEAVQPVLRMGQGLFVQVHPEQPAVGSTRLEDRLRVPTAPHRRVHHPVAGTHPEPGDALADEHRVVPEGAAHRLGRRRWPGAVAALRGSGVPPAHPAFRNGSSPPSVPAPETGFVRGTPHPLIRRSVSSFGPPTVTGRGLSIRGPTPAMITSRSRPACSRSGGGTSMRPWRSMGQG